MTVISRNLGYVDFDVPTGIAIYPKDFESKEEVVKILDDYNSRMEAEGKDEQVITYTDMVGTLMSSVTDIIDIISYVLIAFVAISLVVSSIMIGVITYISVLERKERNWNPAGHRSLQGKYFPGIQCGDLYHRALRGAHWNRALPFCF